MQEYQIQFSGDTIQYFTWESLNRANNRAIRMNLNRQIQKSYINKMDKALRFPVQLSLLKEGASDMFNCIRYVLITDTDGNTVHIDVPERFVKTDVFKMEVEV
tara:strand:+ start:7359 stop:7667 length:309 start_codon:yes stop_codon:yes gene_type:complete